MGYRQPFAVLLAVAMVPVGCAPMTEASLGARGSVALEAGRRKIPLSILVTGADDSPRRADFVQFLGEHFERVGVDSYSFFHGVEAEDWDVIVFDAEARPGAGGIELPHRPPLAGTYRRASILVQGAGVRAVSHLNPKVDELGAGLSHSAHGVNLDHPIFQGPFEVDLAFEDTRVPEHYVRTWNNLALGGTLPTWRVDQQSYLDNDALAPGVVSTGWGFADSPDAEVIASGLNTEGPNAVALGRHGPFFHWGFAGSPSQMTEAGRSAFLNAIVYIAAFDRGRLMVERAAPAREEVLDYLHQVRSTSDNDSYLLRFPSEMVARFGTESPAPYAAFYAENMEYLVFDEANRTFRPDPDARALGVSNRSVAILDLAIQQLRGGTPDEKVRAQRILLRYTAERFDRADAWGDWLEGVRDSLFFSDVGGFRFRVGARPLGPVDAARAAHLALAPAPREDWQRLVADVHLSKAAAQPGDTIMLTVRLAFSPGWHAYAKLPETSPYRQTSLELSLPAGIEAEGPWALPSAKPSPTEPGGTEYSGDAVFVRALKIGPQASGKLSIPVALSYQACNQDSCLRPTKETLEVALDVQP